MRQRRVPCLCAGVEHLPRGIAAELERGALIALHAYTGPSSGTVRGPSEGAGGHGRVAGTRAGMHAGARAGMHTGTRGGTAVRTRALCL